MRILSLNTLGKKEIASELIIVEGRSLDRKSRVECGGTSLASTMCTFKQELEESGEKSEMTRSGGRCRDLVA